MDSKQTPYYPPRPVKIQDPEWLVEFMSEFALNDKNKELFIKAIMSYHHKCYNAALELETDLENIPGVNINH